MEFVIYPILAQRLLINMRRVDYMGSELFALKLLFAHPVPGSEGGLYGNDNSVEVTPAPPCLQYYGVMDELSGVDDTRE
jgi:hypothetical protein